MRVMRVAPAAAALVCIAGIFAAPTPAQTPHTHQHSFSDAEKWARVADLGAGTGYFSARLANMLQKGLVYAVDIEPDMVRFLSERAKREGLRNMVAVAGIPDNPRLPEKVDLILLVDVYHHIEDRARYFRRLSASLRPGGRIAVIDFTLDSPEGPPRAARVAPEKVKAEMQAAGHVLAAEHRFLPYQYFLVFRPAS